MKKICAILFLSLFLFVTAAAAWNGTPKAPILDVQIETPADGATVLGIIGISGSSEDVGNGMVSVSINGGPFLPAQDLDPWCFELDTATLSDGPQNIRARARQGVSGTPVFDEINVVVDNDPNSLKVEITSPAEGTTLLSTFTVSGKSNGATLVEVSVDGGPFETANGIQPWEKAFGQGSLTIGPHIIDVRATNGIDQVFDQVSITIDIPSSGSHEVQYSSSIDGEPLGGVVHVPSGFHPSNGPVPLVIHLHGGGSMGNISPDMAQELDARGWIGIAPHARDWVLADLCCPWRTSAAYVDNPDPRVGSGERDILDFIDWAEANFPIDPDRIYLMGFSMGGRGTYIIGLKNPGRFAAIAPMGPAVDMYEIYNRRPDPRACKEGMTGGEPGDSGFVDTMYSITSGRFLLENAYNLPVFHGHGLLDTTANNDPVNAPFLHGWHMTTDVSWESCHNGNELCFGHTPTLSELNALHKTGYDWAYMFSPIGHSTDPIWLHGTPIIPGVFGIEDPQNPGNYIGIFDFFGRRTLVHSPDTVVYKSYTDTHRDAYWMSIDIDHPWEDTPGAVRAQRNTTTNLLRLELIRIATATVDLNLANLAVQAGTPLVVLLEPLIEEVFDPALEAPGEPLQPSLVLSDDFTANGQIRVFQDGQPVPPSLVDRTATEITIGPLDITALSALRVVDVGSQSIFIR